MTSTTPRRAPRHAVPAAVLLAASLALSACSSGAASSSATDAPADTVPLTVQLSWVFNEEFAGEYAADTNGYYAEAGLGPVQLVPGPSAGVPELLSRTADVAFSDAVSIGAAVAREDAPLKIIGSVFQENPFTVLSLADGSDITEPADLVGKRIGVQDGNTALFSALLAANDIAADEVTVVPVQFDPAPLINGEVDGFIAYVTNEPVALEAKGIATSSLPFAMNGLPFVAKSVAVTDESIEADREALKSFLLAEIRGWADAIDDVDETVRLVTEEYGTELDLDPAIVRAGAEAQVELVTSPDTEQNGLLTISPELQSLTIGSLVEAGIVVEASELFDLSLLEEVYAEHPDLLDLAH
jgi:ABC-type nitrate/sulfonate/bicarbonate transport system substrate-binding protein